MKTAEQQGNRLLGNVQVRAAVAAAQQERSQRTKITAGASCLLLKVKVRAAIRAAIRAGYSEKTADAIGKENLRKPPVAAAIPAAQAVRSERTQITADEVLQGFSAIAQADARELIEYPATTPSGSIIEALRHIRSKPASRGRAIVERGLIVGEGRPAIFRQRTSSPRIT